MHRDGGTTGHRVEQQPADIDGEDDEVIEELDVYLNRLDEATSIYVLQYPLRPSYRPYGDQGRLHSVEYRQCQGTLRLNYDLNTHGSNFDTDKNMDGAVVQGRVDSDGDPIINHSLASSNVYDPNCTYAVGIRHEGKLYLTQVNKFMQFRPQFSYVDRAVEVSQKRASAHFARTAVEAADASPSSSAKTKAKRGDVGTATVTAEPGDDSMLTAQDAALTPEAWLARANTMGVFFDQDGAIREVTEGRQKIPFGKLNTLLEAEPWTAVETLYDAESTESYEVMELLCSFEIMAPEEQETTDADEGVDEGALSAMGIGRTSAVEGARRSSSSAVSSTPKKNVKYVSKRVSDGPYVPEIMFHPELASYMDTLCGTAAQRNNNTATGAASTGSSSVLSYQSLSRKPVEQQVLVILKHRHVLTFNNVKSLVTRKLDDAELVQVLLKFGTLVYGNWVCKSEFVYDGYEALCRDLLLIRLQMKKTATQREVFCKQTKLPMPTVTEMLQQVAEFRGTAWHFKLPPDTDFVSRFPKEQDAAIEWWRNRMQVVREDVISLQRKASALATATPGTSNFDRGKLLRLLEKILKDCGALSSKDVFSESTKRSKLVTGSPVGPFNEADIIQLLPDFAIDIRGVWALKSLGDQRIDAWRDVLITYFRTNREPRSKDAIMREISGSVQQLEAIPDLVLRSLLREFAANKGGLWHFKQPPDDSKEGGARK